MATEILSGPIGEVRAASAANGGTALTTTAGYIQLPKNTRYIYLIPRNFGAALVVKYALNPWLWVLKTADSMASVPTDYSEFAQDGDAATDVDLSSLDTLANGDSLWIGSHLPFRGVYCDIDTTNGTGTTSLTVVYWQGNTLLTISPTEGTKSTTSFDQDGGVTWTVPSGWQSATLEDICRAMGMPLTNAEFPARREKLYWTRWTVDAALDSTTTLNSMVAMNRSTAYTEIPVGLSWEGAVHRGTGGIGCVEALTDAGTANLIINVATARDAHF